MIGYVNVTSGNENNFAISVRFNKQRAIYNDSRILDKSIGGKGDGFVLDTYDSKLTKIQ